MAISTARLLSTGRVPGRPRQTGQTSVFGGSPKRVEQPQKIFVRVRSWTWTSKPMTGADFDIRDKDYSRADAVAGRTESGRPPRLGRGKLQAVPAASRAMAKSTGLKDPPLQSGGRALGERAQRRDEALG